MATLTFKVTDQEARLIRSKARKERVIPGKVAKGG